MHVCKHGKEVTRTVIHMGAGTRERNYILNLLIQKYNNTLNFFNDLIDTVYKHVRVDSTRLLKITSPL